jgi:hypothetical protein
VELRLGQGKALFPQGERILYVLGAKAHAQETVIRRELSPTALAQTHPLVAVFVVPETPEYHMFRAAFGAFDHENNLLA